MILLAQLGAIGFDYYKVTCSKSNTSTYSIKDVGCCCKKKTKEFNNKKSCCSKKKKSCCSKSSCSVPQIANNCCSSTLLTFKIFSESFTNENNEVNTNINKDIIVLQPIAAKGKIAMINEINDGYYHCNSPPFKNFDSRIFIQSFQI